MNCPIRAQPDASPSWWQTIPFGSPIASLTFAAAAAAATTTAKLISCHLSARLVQPADQQSELAS